MSEITKNSRHTKLMYAQNLDLYQHEKPYQVLSFLNGGKYTTNLSWEKGSTETITNIRGSEHLYTLDEHGFCFRHAPTACTQWLNKQQVEEKYLPEVESLLKEKVEDVDEVVIFDWRRRQQRCQSTMPLFTNMNNPSDPLRPASQVHLDQSPNGVLKRTRLLMEDRADYLLQGRVRLINVWRPLNIVDDWPLALCDGSSMNYDDLLEVDLIRQDYIGSTMYGMYRPGYKWYYLENQTPDEVCFFKNFDSSKDAKVQKCPHVSFPQDNAPTYPAPRESIEVRALVFTYPQEMGQADREKNGR